MLNALVDFLFPRTCLHCRQLLSGDERDLCPRCRGQIEQPDEASEHRVRDRLTESGMISDVVSLSVFIEDGPSRALIHALKYHGYVSLGLRLGSELGCVLQKLGVGADLVVPVPLSRRKRRERGYNQAVEIARGISRATGISCATGLLVRVRDTASQTTLRVSERRANVLHAFTLRPGAHRRIDGARCLLVDDVVTTGATLIACAEVLHRARARDVVACTLGVAR